MIDKIFLFLFSPERLFLPLFFSDVQMFRTIIYFGLIWFRHFLNFTAAYLMYDYYDIWSTYLHVKIFGWLIGLRASPDKLDEIAWVSGLPTASLSFSLPSLPFSPETPDTQVIDVTTDLTLTGSICMWDAHPLFDNSYLIIFRRTELLVKKDTRRCFGIC